MEIKTKNENEKPDLTSLSGVTLGLTLVVGVCFFSFLGYFFEKKTGNVYWTLGGIFLGLFYCGYEVWRYTRLINKKNDTKS